MEFRIDGLKELRQKVGASASQTKANIKRTMIRGKTEWMREAKFRVPVDTGVTRNTILGDVTVTNDEATCSVGSNQEHAKHIEFGTDWIAGGSVKALGTRPDITDADAIHTWAAKEENATKKTSYSANINTGRLHNRGGLEIDGKRGAVGRQEQMPWLRTSFIAIRPKILAWLGDCLKPKN